ncbi:uncharacterized protein [Cicer arietinum]|uniref:uncharacterized protein isoform X2 n=1 Tax=Cicer arietinum TaxID=3827 RepID=UPI000640F724
MEPRPEHRIGSGEWRHRSELLNTSISELISELRDTFLRSDFDRVEETLVARETMLKAEIEEKKSEIRLLTEKVQLERLEKISVELELKRFKEGGNVGVLVVDEPCKKDGLEVSDIEHQSSSVVVKKNHAARPTKPIDRVEEEALVVREAMLKAVIEEKVREIGLPQEKSQFKNWGRLNFEIEVKMVRGERQGNEFVKVVGNGNRFGLDDGKIVKAGVGHEKCKFEILKNRGVGDVEDCVVAELEGEKVEVLAEKKRLVGEPNKEDGLGGFGRSALGAVQKNHGTRLAKHIEIRPGNDLDCEEETLVVRQAMLKAAIEEKMREIRLMQEKNEFKSWGRLNFEVDVKMVEGERCGEELVKVGENGNGFGLDDGKVVKAELGHERCKLDGLKSSGVGNGEAHVVAELEGERVNVFAEKKRLAGEPSKKDGLGASDNEWKISSATFQKNLATKLVEPIGNLKRDFAGSREYVTKMNILDGLDSDSSSSSSSSSSDDFDMDIPPLTSFKSNKKMRTNAGQSWNELLTKLKQGTANHEGRCVRPTASAQAQRLEEPHEVQLERREWRAQQEQRRLQQQQAQQEAQQKEDIQQVEQTQHHAQPDHIDEPPQVDGYPGGPIDKSVLRTFGDHVATRLWDGVDRGELRVFSNGKKLKEVVIEHEEVEQLVKSSGLYSLLKCSYEMIDKGIISAFVERWHRDTNSFHLPIGEMTITLDDVSSLLHIPITGAFFSVNVLNKDDSANLLTELLGVTKAYAYAEFNVTRTTTVRYSWLLELYHQRCRDQHWEMAARAFLLFLVGCTLFSDKSAFAVSVAYLECFRDLNSCGGYAWGAAALAYLYDNLREASMHQTRTISGYLTLLQAWVYEHFPTLCVDCCRPLPRYVEANPRALRWKPKRDKGLVLPFRKVLDEIHVDQICWTPYKEHRLRRPFEDVCLFRGWIRWGPKMYAHLPDRVLRQYGHVQTIPRSPLEIIGQTTTLEEIDIIFTQYALHVVDAGAVVQGPADCTNDYMEWFNRISHPYIIRREPIHVGLSVAKSTHDVPSTANITG